MRKCYQYQACWKILLTLVYRLKGIAICFSMLKAALSGNYVSFGVFRLYGDDALDNSLNTFVKLLLSIPQSDLLVSYHGCCCLILLCREVQRMSIFQGCHVSGKSQGKTKFSPGQGIVREFWKNVREFCPFDQCQGIVREFCHDN